jgi:hypothetical protein
MVLIRADGASEKQQGVEFNISIGTPDDTASTFIVPLSALKSDQSFADQCFREGLMYDQFGKRVKPFMTAWVTLVQEAKGLQSVNRMGWIEDGGNVIGFAYGGHASPPDYKKCGVLNEWQNGAGTVINKGCIEMEVLIATAFAAPIMRSTGVDGGIVHARAPSGRGKTASFEIAASVWASIRSVLGSGTTASTRDLVAVAHNLPVYADEFVVDSKTDFNKFGELILNITTGKEHRRMTRTIQQRQRRFSQTLLFTAGNFSLVRKTSRQTTAQALRVLEIEVSDAISRLGHTLDQVVVIRRLLENNHGTAGTIYAEYLDKHHVSIDEAVVLCTREFSKQLNIVESERFWLATIVAIYIGATIAKNLRLLDFDIVSMKKYLFNLVRQQRAELFDISIDADDPIVLLDRTTEFVNQRIGTVIFTQMIARQGTNASTIEHVNSMTTRPPYAGRIATEDKIMLLSEAQLMGWCRQQEHDYHQMKRLLIKANYCTRPKNRRKLGGGTNLPSPPASEYVLEFDLSKPELARFLNLETGE